MAKTKDTKREFNLGDLEEARHAIDKWINQFPEGYWPFHIMVLQLVEELGELAKEINHEYGMKKKKKEEKKGSLEQELGDVFFTLLCMANTFQLGPLVYSEYCPSIEWHIDQPPEKSYAYSTEKVSELIHIGTGLEKYMERNESTPDKKQIEKFQKVLHAVLNHWYRVAWDLNLSPTSALEKVMSIRYDRDNDRFKRSDKK